MKVVSPQDELPGCSLTPAYDALAMNAVLYGASTDTLEEPFRAYSDKWNHSSIMDNQMDTNLEM